MNLVRLSPSIDDKFKYAWLSLEVIPGRLEAVHSLLQFLRERNIWNLQAYTIGVTAASLSAEKKQGDEALFLEPEVYLYQFDDELAIQAFYTNHKDACARHSFKALQRAPAEHRARIQTNYEFSLQA